MKDLRKFQSPLNFLLTDIDDTLTDEGLLSPSAYHSIWTLHQSGVQVIPVTGRPAGWCEMIARSWPVAAVVGENGGFYFRYHQKKMHRHYFFDEKTQELNRKKLDMIKDEVLSAVPGCSISSDQFCRKMDLAIDFCEDVPALEDESVQTIVERAQKHGAQAKVSSIHVNIWFGEYNKVSQALNLLNKEFQLPTSEAIKVCGFVGDSPNDEPMFETFPNSFAVSNVEKFLPKMKFHPQYIASQKGGLGFVEIAERIVAVKRK